MALIKGTDGLLTVGPSGAPTTVGYITKYSIDMETDITQRGPYIGNAAKSKVLGGNTSSGTMTVDVPVNRDAGHTAIVTAHAAGTGLRLVAREGGTTEGYTYTAASALFTTVTSTGSAEEGYTLEIAWEDDAGYTYAVSS